MPVVTEMPLSILIRNNYCDYTSSRLEVPSNYGDFWHVHISYGISKLGKDIPCVSLPAGVTCRKDAPCKTKCYANKGRFRMKQVKQVVEKNLELWEKAPEIYEFDISMAAFRAKFFRWHSSGDIPSYEYLLMMVRVALRNPSTLFLAFTKQVEFVNTYLHINRELPSNLKIVFSQWGDKFIPHNPYNLPVAYVKFKNGESCVPEDAIQCSGFCGTCINSLDNCWRLRKGDSVVFDEH